MSSRLTDFTQWDPQYQHSQHYTYANSFKMSYNHQPRHAPSLNIAAAAAEATQGSDLPVGNMTNTSSGQYHSVQPQTQVNGPSYNLPFSNNSMQYMSGSPLYSNSNNHPLSAGASSHGGFHNGRHSDFNNGSTMSMSASSMQTSYDFHHQGSLQSPSHSDLISSHPFDNPGMFPVKAKRKQVKNACVNCQKACKRCDEGRPCSRCIKYGLTATCMDSARKERKRGIKRGPYKRRATTGSQPTGTNWGNHSYLHSSSSSMMLGHGNGYSTSPHHHHNHHHGMALHSAPLYSTTQPMRSNLNEGQTSFNDVSRSPIDHLPHGSTDSLINNTSAPATVQRPTIPLNSLSYDTASSTSPSMYGREHNPSNGFLNASSNHHRLHNSENGLAILSNGSTATTSSILSPRTPNGSSETGNNVVGEYHLTSTSPGGQQKMNGNNTTTSSLTNLTTGAFLNPMNQSGNSTFPLHLPQAARLRGMNNGSTPLPLNAFANEKSSINNFDSRPRYNNSYSHDESCTPVNANHNNNEVEGFEVDRASQYLPRKRFVASSPIVRPLL
ncbi:uncharacterized protein FA14DRAFT_14838 [Meira miltonrushii]|uniref:Transcription activator of gluconeogenesis ERT1 n=1 Tax=Meira miltonrushii TaxID=1280837 RepID=A0A316VIY5_9BASI|nr:uncharacterized protein FA14DRAFT_14838 [Meira miltonrushii]PWN37506.1 hypothetical protein FA14DRAFT_14838 [Meira miltonrushii]